MALKTINDEYLSAIGSAIREKNGTENTYKPKDMAAAILDITTGGGSGGDLEIPVITGDCQNRFSYDGWNWVIEAFGDQLQTVDITNCSKMFYFNYNLEEIPFEINCKEGTGIDISNMFAYSYKITTIPKINNCKPSDVSNLFLSCYNIRYLPEDIDSWFDWSGYEESTVTYSFYKYGETFKNCHSLRSAPIALLTHENSLTTSHYNTIYYSTFDGCYSLDEIIDLPIDGKWVLNAQTGNMFGATFNNCSRVKNITFRLYGDKVRPVKWKSQVIDLTKDVGYAQFSGWVTNQNSGITQDKEVTDDATYQALKNDPDWFTTNVSYSRYNHDSAVATINSLPDASNYLYSSSGTNTIKFLGQSGELTDGGAINTLTDEEIAVAAAKGWTVTLT